MERKSIGKFIAVLRRANGMTQRELGERLYVSDKTVSRWECDECTPELSLIPAIAEIFGVTADELLRGERSNPERSALESAEHTERQRAKSERQFKLMLDRTHRRYKILTLISVGISVVGLLAAAVANLGFSRGLIAFCIACAFSVASEICQICFAVNARILQDEDDDIYCDRIADANLKIIRGAVAVSFVNVMLVAFCLPLVTLINGANYGLTFATWLSFGVLFSAIAFVVCYVLYALIIRNSLCKRGLIVLSENAEMEIRKNVELLKKTVSAALAIALALGVLIFVWNVIGWEPLVREYTFDTCEEFKKFVERDYRNWLTEGYSYKNDEGEIVVEIPVGHVRTDAEIRNADGKVICEYYYNPDLYEKISFTSGSYDKLPVTVVSKQAKYDAKDAFYTVESILYALIVLDFVGASAVHLAKLNKKEKG